MVICLERGADLHMAQLMPLPLTVSCFSKIQAGFTFLVPAHLGSPRKGPLNGCVCVCMCCSSGGRIQAVPHCQHMSKACVRDWSLVANDSVCILWFYRDVAYVPASQPQLHRRPELFVTSRKQLQPNQQRITLSISGIGTLIVVHCIIQQAF